jgi:hypothetical protein
MIDTLWLLNIENLALLLTDYTYISKS